MSPTFFLLTGPQGPYSNAAIRPTTTTPTKERCPVRLSAFSHFSKMTLAIILPKAPGPHNADETLTKQLIHTNLTYYFHPITYNRFKLLLTLLLPTTHHSLFYAESNQRQTVKRSIQSKALGPTVRHFLTHNKVVSKPSCWQTYCLLTVNVFAPLKIRFPSSKDPP